MSHHNRTRQPSEDDEEDDPLDRILKKSGCADLHYKVQNAALFDDEPQVAPSSGLRTGRGPLTGTISSKDYLTKSKQGHSKGGNSVHV
uniref:Uncharacterized protein n=1 Tax=Magallana gigas TaxID=29159 RepID=K1QV97_MAGGI